LNLPAIYPITDSTLSRLSIPDQVEEMAAAGARLIQIRAKSTAPGKFLSDAIEALAVARRFGAKLIVNDRVDIAIAAGADGVHLGQSDLPPKYARDLLGEDAIIGYSTHDVSQAVEAMREPIDYIAIGPVFPTTTKADHDPVIGLEIVRSVRQALGNFPLVAIGGITLDDARSVIEAGADSVAVIGAIHAKDSAIKGNIQHLLNRLLAKVSHC
jgi:thiamine-phosphate pyrophosphorylase